MLQLVELDASRSVDGELEYNETGVGMEGMATFPVCPPGYECSEHGAVAGRRDG